MNLYWRFDPLMVSLIPPGISAASLWLAQNPGVTIRDLAGCFHCAHSAQCCKSLPTNEACLSIAEVRGQPGPIRQSLSLLPPPLCLRQGPLVLNWHICLVPGRASSLLEHRSRRQERRRRRRKNRARASTRESWHTLHLARASTDAPDSDSPHTHAHTPR